MYVIIAFNKITNKQSYFKCNDLSLILNPRIMHYKLGEDNLRAQNDFSYGNKVNILYSLKRLYWNLEVNTNWGTEWNPLWPFLNVYRKQIDRLYKFNFNVPRYRTFCLFVCGGYFFLLCKTTFYTALHKGTSILIGTKNITAVPK